MIPQSSLSIATEGIGFTDSTMVGSLGYGGYTIEVIIPPPGNFPELLGGGSAPSRLYTSKQSKTADKQTTKPVIVKLTLNGKTTTRTYMVRPNKFRMIIKVVNIINTLTSSFNVGINNIKTTSNKIVNVFFNNK